MIDYSLGRFLRDPSVCAQPIEKVDICRQLVTGVKYLHSRVSLFSTDQNMSSLGKVPIEFLPGKRHITWVLAVLLFSTEIQMEPLAPYAISYDTRPTTY